MAAVPPSGRAMLAGMAPNPAVKTADWMVTGLSVVPCCNETDSGEPADASVTMLSCGSKVIVAALTEAIV